MDSLVLLRIAQQGGVLTTADALECGLRHRDLTALVRRGDLVRVRSAAYVDGERWRRADAQERYRLACVAVARSFEGRWLLSHRSALAVQRLPLLRHGGPVHLSRMEPGPLHNRTGVVVHGPVNTWTSVDGVRIVPTAHALLQTAAADGLEEGLVAADAALHRRLVTPDQLGSALEGLRIRRRRRTALQVVRLADGRMESVGESRTRLVLHGGGLHPEPQVRIWDGGELVARVDFLFREARVVVEFDGDVKYAAADGRVALVREKRREDRLRRLGFTVVRLCWRDLDDPARVVAVVRAALAAAPSPFGQDQYGSR